MQASREDRFVKIIGMVAGIGIAAAAGCSRVNTVDTGTTSNSGTSTPIGGGGTSGTVGGTGASNGGATSGSGNAMTFGLVASPNYTYKMHDASDTTTFTTPCQVQLGATNPANDEMCIIEATELDLYFFGAAFTYNVPKAMCSYVNWIPYYYYELQPGDGTATIKYDVDENGSVGQDTDNNGVINNGTVTVTGSPGVSVVGVKPVCAYDYSPGPNCCTGSYTTIVRTWNSTGTTPGYQITTSNANWGGNPANCLSGPAVASQPKGPSGFPLPILTDVTGTGLANTYAVAGPNSMLKTGDVYLANYFSAATPTPIVQPYYELQCWDQAQEIKARMRLMIRKWNTAAEFAKNGAGNPNLVGNEPPPFGTSPNDDRYAWPEFGNAYPGE